MWTGEVGRFSIISMQDQRWKRWSGIETGLSRRPLWHWHAHTHLVMVMAVTLLLVASPGRDGDARPTCTISNRHPCHCPRPPPPTHFPLVQHNCKTFQIQRRKIILVNLPIGYLTRIWVICKVYVQKLNITQKFMFEMWITKINWCNTTIF